MQGRENVSIQLYSSCFHLDLVFMGGLCDASAMDGIQKKAVVE